MVNATVPICLGLKLCHYGFYSLFDLAEFINGMVLPLCFCWICINDSNFSDLILCVFTFEILVLIILQEYSFSNGCTMDFAVSVAYISVMVNSKPLPR